MIFFFFLYLMILFGSYAASFVLEVLFETYAPIPCVVLLCTTSEVYSVFSASMTAGDIGVMFYGGDVKKKVVQSEPSQFCQ